MHVYWYRLTFLAIPLYRENVWRKQDVSDFVTLLFSNDQSRKLRGKHMFLCPPWNCWEATSSHWWNEASNWEYNWISNVSQKMQSEIFMPVHQLRSVSASMWIEWIQEKWNTSVSRRQDVYLCRNWGMYEKQWEEVGRKRRLNVMFNIYKLHLF